MRLDRPVAALLLVGLVRVGAATSTNAAEPSPSSGWTLRSNSLLVELRADGALALRSTGSTRNWESVIPDHPVVAVKSAKTDPNGRTLLAKLAIDGRPWDLVLRLDDAEPAVEIQLLGLPGSALTSDMPYPFALRAPGPEWRAVVPQKSGLLFRPTDAEDPKVPGKYLTYEGPGLSMPWYGLTDLHAAVMTILETPNDSGLELQLAGEGESRVFTAGPIWQPSMGTVRYPRRMRIQLIGDGGYVAMAKRYRRYLQDRGEFVTLRQKATARPPLAKLIGALDVHLRGDDDDLRSIVKGLEVHGARQLLLNTSAAPRTIAWMQARGCLVGTYRIYTDIHPPGTPGQNPIYSRGYPDDAYTLPNGGPVHGFAYSDQHRTTYRSSVLQLPLMAELVPPLLHQNGYGAIFLDVTTSSRLTEDYSQRHFLDRTADRQARVALLNFATSQGVVVGSEDGNDWAATSVDYLEGMTMPRRFLDQPGVTINNYTQKFAPNQEYRDFILNEKVRAPLWDLVFHDAVISSWRWEFTPNRYSEPDAWVQQNLIQILQGDMPILVLNRSILEECGELIGRTCRDVCAWNQKIGWDELVDNRALASDRTVQESRFSSGWAVTVNFSPEKAFVLPDGSTVAPKSFAIHRW